MTDWRAVAVGFVVLLVVGGVGLSLPLVGPVVSLVAGLGTFLLAALAVLLFAVDSAVAGAVGGLLKRRPRRTSRGRTREEHESRAGRVAIGHRRERRAESAVGGGRPRRAAGTPATS
jgi:LytS/YehU family sensor histidine kinase